MQTRLPGTAFTARPASWWSGIRGRARPHGPFTHERLGRRSEWRRDVALLGGITATLAPLCTLVWVTSVEPWTILQSIASGLLGAGLGYAMGGAWHAAFTRTFRRRSLAFLVVFVLITAAPWGLVTGFFGAAPGLNEMPFSPDIGWLVFSGVGAAAAAALQSAWFVPLYAYRRARDLGTTRLLWIAALVSTGLGWAALWSIAGVETLLQALT
jgi:hypothetical protein